MAPASVEINNAGKSPGPFMLRIASRLIKRKAANNTIGTMTLRSATAGEGARRCGLNVEVSENSNAERPAVRCIAWLGASHQSFRRQLQTVQRGVFRSGALVFLRRSGLRRRTRATPLFRVRG